MKPWPYPLWIAHRGAGTLAPENTLEAFRVGLARGYRAFECDVKISADGVPFLLHDATLQRTTDGSGIAGHRRWHDLARLDAGRWHGLRTAGEPLARLDDVARLLIEAGAALNIEIKPTPGTDRETGEVVARQAGRLWSGRSPPPLLSSFRLDALRAARTHEPSLPRALILESLPTDWFDTALELDCAAVVLHHPLVDAPLVSRLHAWGMAALCYTVNDADEARRLQSIGVDGIVTDAIDRLGP